MVSLQEARSIICAQILPLDSSPTPLTGARGRILGADVFAPEDFPAFDRSAMDGYAIRQGDCAPFFEVIAEVRPGEQADFELKPGECARIFTGGRLPGGGLQVLMQENVSREGDRMIPLQHAADEPLHIRHRGEDARSGDRLLKAGTRLRAPELAILAQIGLVTPSIVGAPRVIHLATGAELVEPSLQPEPGQIRDSNSTLIAALLAESGAELVRQSRCGDTLEALVGEVNAAAEAWDLLLISGGASVGDYDFGARALAALGFQIHFRAVNLRPGKPMIFATRGRQLAFVIPGNPVSHFVVFHTAIRLALECLEKSEPQWNPVDLPIAHALSDQAGPRDTYWPARVEVKEGRFEALPLAWRSSGDLCGLAGANALIERLAGSGPIAAGANVKSLLLPNH